MKNTIIITIIFILVILAVGYFLNKECYGTVCNSNPCFGDMGCVGDCICVKRPWEVKGFCWSPY